VTIDSCSGTIHLFSYSNVFWFSAIVMNPFSSSIRFFHVTVLVSVLGSHRLEVAESGSFVFKADPFRLKPAAFPEESRLFVLLYFVI
jgi:hypothetical protein